jgi:hypothetical protein
MRAVDGKKTGDDRADVRRFPDLPSPGKIDLDLVKWMGAWRQTGEI